MLCCRDPKINMQEFLTWEQKQNHEREPKQTRIRQREKQKESERKEQQGQQKNKEKNLISDIPLLSVDLRRGAFPKMRKEIENCTYLDLDDCSILGNSLNFKAELTRCFKIN